MDNKAEEENPKSNSMAAFSPQMTDFAEALDVLYIRNNASGRNKFKEKWPDAAQYLFGAQLIQYDYEGPKDLDHRKQLEEEASERRLALREILVELVDKSVDAGALQFEYVGEVIDKVGPLLSTFFYAEDVIERVRPGVLAKVRDEQENGSDNTEEEIPSEVSETPKAVDDYASSDDRSLLEAEKEILSSVSDDDLDDIKPIDVSDGNTGSEMMAEAAEADLASISPQAGSDTPDDTTEVKAAEAIEENVADVSAEIAEAMQIKKEAVGVATFEDAPLPSAPADLLDDVKPIETAPPPLPPVEEPVEEKASEVPPSVTKTPDINDLDDVKPIETPPPVVEDAPKAEEPVDVPTPVAPSLSDEKPADDRAKQDKPDIFGAPSAAAAVQPEEEKPAESAKVEKGIYKVLFNTAAKAA